MNDDLKDFENSEYNPGNEEMKLDVLAVETLRGGMDMNAALNRGLKKFYAKYPQYKPVEEESGGKGE